VNKAQLLVAFFVASASALLSVLMIHRPDVIGAAGVFCLPGAIFAIVISGNVHDFATWPVAVGNFAFYFGLSYLFGEIAQRYSRGAAHEQRDSKATEARKR
jgi:hypothetical protein